MDLSVLGLHLYLCSHGLCVTVQVDLLAQILLVSPVFPPWIMAVVPPGIMASLVPGVSEIGQSSSGLRYYGAPSPDFLAFRLKVASILLTLFR